MVTQKESLDSLFQERGPDPWGYSSPHVLQRLEKSIAFIRRHVPSSFQGEFVELGAFNGAFSRHLRERFPAASLIVNDVADAAIAQARRNLAGLPRLQIVQADLAEMCPSTSQATRIILLLECLYYRAHEERAGVLRHLIMAFEQAPIFISGPITGGSYFTEPWLIEQFAAAGYELADSAALTLRPSENTSLSSLRPIRWLQWAGRAKTSSEKMMQGAGRRAARLRMKSANQVIYYFRVRRGRSNPFARLIFDCPSHRSPT